MMANKIDCRDPPYLILFTLVRLVTFDMPISMLFLRHQRVVEAWSKKF